MWLPDTIHSKIVCPYTYTTVCFFKRYLLYCSKGFKIKVKHRRDKNKQQFL